MLLSNIETAIGCVASSVPTIRLFYIRNRRASPSTGAQTPTPQHGSKSLVTFGSTPISHKATGPKLGSKSRGMFRNPTDTGLSYATVHAKGGDWERLQDGDSDKGNLLEENVGPKKGIRTDYTYSVELSQSPRHGQRTYLEDERSVDS